MNGSHGNGVVTPETSRKKSHPLSSRAISLTRQFPFLNNKVKFNGVFLNERSLGFYWPHSRVATLKKLYTNAFNERNKLCTKSYHQKDHQLKNTRSYENINNPFHDTLRVPAGKNQTNS